MHCEADDRAAIRALGNTASIDGPHTLAMKARLSDGGVCDDEKAHLVDERARTDAAMSLMMSSDLKVVSTVLRVET